MGYIKAAVDPYSQITLKTFQPVQPNTDIHMERRSGTYSVIGLDGGVDPYGANSMPVNTRDVTFAFREYFHKAGQLDSTHHRSMDSARDALMYAVGGGMPVRLEYVTDFGQSRYVNAKAKNYPHVITVDSDFSADFSVTFEMADVFWSDLFPANLPTWGSFSWGDGTIWGGAPFAMNPTAGATTVYLANLTGATAFDLPKITITGPYGGSLGFQILNNSLQIPTAAGMQNVYLTYGEKLQANEHVTIDTASMDVKKVLSNGSVVNVFDKVVWPREQRYMFMVDPRTRDANPVNTIWISPLGSSAITGGNGLIAFTKRYW